MKSWAASEYWSGLQGLFRIDKRVFRGNSAPVARPFLILALAFLAGCATSPEGRQQLVAPSALQGVSAVYSEVDMRLQMVTARVAPDCQEVECFNNAAFDQRIVDIGGRLAAGAFRAFPELSERFSHFEFVVADKADPGTASTGAGVVVVFRGIQTLELDDTTLGFVLAREMSHVIAGHHDENFATGIWVAVAAQILVPFLNLAPSIATIITGNAATSSAVASTTISSSAVTSAVSFAGSRALRAAYRPAQVREADVLGLRLMAASGWPGRSVSRQLEYWSVREASAEWCNELKESTYRIASLMQGPEPAPALETLAAARP